MDSLIRINTEFPKNAEMVDRWKNNNQTQEAA